MNPTRTLWIPGLVACGFIGGAGLGLVSPANGGPGAAATLPADEVALASVPSGVDIAGVVTPAAAPVALDPREVSLRSDIRVRAFLHAYDDQVDSVTFRDDDLVFSLGDREIYFQDGRMLAESRRGQPDRCDPIFYRYPLEILEEPLPVSDDPVRFCSDLQEALWGRTEAQIRRSARSTTFIGRRMFVNEVAAEALAEAEQDLRALAETDPGVAAWIEEIDITYSFIDRGIAGTRTRSQHSWGLAVDFVPASYEGLQVYWRWTRAWNRNGWHRTPLEDRWSPPAVVVQTFERHGFLWGGKWAHFDNLHFEYRPEILEYNRLLVAEAKGRAFRGALTQP